MSQVSAAAVGSVDLRFTVRRACGPRFRRERVDVGSGGHKVIANTTLKADVLLMPGAQIEIAAGKT
jgi:hypothetical protein